MRLKDEESRIEVDPERFQLGPSSGVRTAAWRQGRWPINLDASSHKDARMRLTNLIAGFIALALITGEVGAADEAARPRGPVVLTVTGDVGRANRGPLDPFADKLMTFQGTQFARAMEFDHADLWALGTQIVRVQYPGWGAAHTFEGPLLKDVLAAAGVSGGVVQPVALDGYAADIPYADLERWPVILALKMDGRWLPLGGAGPTWVVYPRDDFADLAQSDDAKWVWGVSHIRAMRAR